MRSRLVLAVVPVVLLAVTVAPSLAASKAKPFSKTYEASAPVPAAELACDGTAPMARDLEEIKIPAAGTVKVDLSGFLGDWDLQVLANGKQLGVSQEVQPLTEGESVAVKVKKATTLVINACNYNGGSTGTVAVSFKPS
ncbi:MAG: hypothetical protein H7323_11910 [Frankiales bacterium]|nr:hypothetical protein [Frankiales bacterium]